MICIHGYKSGQNEKAREYYNKLHLKFPNSKRVSKLKALDYESNNKLNDALEIYTEMEDTFSFKQSINILKTQQRQKEAIERLEDRLSVYMNDESSYLELADLYTDGFRKAYCFEELILIDPSNLEYFKRYAQCLVEIGSKEHLVLALSVFKYLGSKTDISVELEECLSKVKDRKLKAEIQDLKEKLINIKE